MNKVLGIVLIVVALAIAIVPNYTDCLSQGKMTTNAAGAPTPMKCHWTAQAEIAIGVPLVGVGAMLSFSRRRRTVLGLGALGVLLGVMAIALPTSLIGTCGMQTMFCNTMMKPSLYALGSLAIVGSAIGMIASSRIKD